MLEKKGNEVKFWIAVDNDNCIYGASNNYQEVINIVKAYEEEQSTQDPDYVIDEDLENYNIIEAYFPNGTRTEKIEAYDSFIPADLY